MTLKEIYKAANSLPVKIVVLKNECMQAGLYKTAHAMETAVKAVGWELAEMIEKEQKRRKPKKPKLEWQKGNLEPR